MTGPGRSGADAEPAGSLDWPVSSQPPQISILDTRLAEIDDRLRTIQDGLATDADRAVEGTAPAPPPPELASLIAELRTLSDTHERLLVTTRDLLASYGGAGPAPAGGGDRVDISVGPLASTDALREFTRALRELPGVRAVDLRGYEGGDRAVLDVQLEPRP